MLKSKKLSEINLKKPVMKLAKKLGHTFSCVKFYKIFTCSLTTSLAPSWSKLWCPPPLPPLSWILCPREQCPACPPWYVSLAAVFLAIFVFRRLAALASDSPPEPGENWSKLMAEFVASLTELEVEGRLFLITQAVHSQGHLLARGVLLHIYHISMLRLKTVFFTCWQSTPLFWKQTRLSRPQGSTRSPLNMQRLDS